MCENTDPVSVPVNQGSASAAASSVGVKTESKYSENCSKTAAKGIVAAGVNLDR